MSGAAICLCSRFIKFSYQGYKNAWIFEILNIILLIKNPCLLVVLDLFMHIVGVRCIAHEKIELGHMLARLLTYCQLNMTSPDPYLCSSVECPTWVCYTF